MPRRRYSRRSILRGVAATGFALAGSTLLTPGGSIAALEPVNPADNPHLRGRFAPVSTEITADDLVIEGSLPPDLTGTYLRNGPNPMFPPLGSYTYPLEGDAMIPCSSISFATTGATWR